MRKNLSLLFISLSALAFGQIAVGKNTITNASVSLEFGTEARGLILPYVATRPQGDAAVPGTIIMDASDGIVKYAKPNGEWKDLTFNTTHQFGGVTVDTTGKVDRSIQLSKREVPTASVIIGKNVQNQPLGVLVLSDSNKAMILPKMESPHLKIANPAAGMMAYDTLTNQLAVFNGTVWTFWKN
ncbi:hypothetical protein [Bergeyella sp. RCAD1439]|uniref:hypothetical protein n=1 Tax=Bergeyella anatis TaxID=3113737 RepID=UPI002E192068|nr:hypothetical protein [Bergeyella sp. RCAD1439]